MPPQHVALAYALTATTGLRAALTLFAIAAAAHAGLIDLSPRMAWLGSASAMWVLGGLALLDFAGDKIPAVDNALHALHTFVKPVAGGIAAAAVIPGADDPLTALFMVLGGGNALAVHGLDATTRIASTAFSAGMLNPVLSFAGDAAALGGIALALAAPFAAAVVILILTAIAAGVAWRVVRARRARRSGARSPRTT